MKKFSIAILAVIYFTISCGIVFNVHYCMGKLSAVKVDLLAKNLCGCGSEDGKEKKCCKTEHKLVKLEDNHKASFADYVFQAPVADIARLNNFLQATILPEIDTNDFHNHSPPLLIQEDTYLLNCVFRI